VEGVFRIRLQDGRERHELFVAAPGPMGLRWFGRVREPGSEEDLVLVDHTVDRAWRLVRFRLVDLEAGAEVVATADPAGIGVERAGGTAPGSWVVPGAAAVWGPSPSVLFVLRRLAAASGGGPVPAATVGPASDPAPVTVLIDPPEGDRVDVQVDGERFEATFRDDWPVWAEGRFELLPPTP
jgi:hypothetical protein